MHFDGWKIIVCWPLIADVEQTLFYDYLLQIIVTVILFK